MGETACCLPVTSLPFPRWMGGHWVAGGCWRGGTSEETLFTPLPLPLLPLSSPWRPDGWCFSRHLRSGYKREDERWKLGAKSGRASVRKSLGPDEAGSPTPRSTYLSSSSTRERKESSLLSETLLFLVSITYLQLCAKIFLGWASEAAGGTRKPATNWLWWIYTLHSDQPAVCNSHLINCFRSEMRLHETVFV